ncbi:hypothetical protein L1077_12620 [Pseudoalteromonas luteoviolacea]|uniref:hypothetical protein n=1 Tax=Pseudoalteromonas luteoviolacea TaxID=43657 RepID=UPI001F3735A0|nr:hypothetical protein [Pseudoalteromonas luteoviolacea]MCF6440282.1 hypothetical protein [Pseudoalteromonas luteoviolacea]
MSKNDRRHTHKAHKYLKNIIVYSPCDYFIKGKELKHFNYRRTEKKPPSKRITPTDDEAKKKYYKYQMVDNRKNNYFIHT